MRAVRYQSIAKPLELRDSWLPANGGQDVWRVA